MGFHDGSGHEDKKDLPTPKREGVLWKQDLQVLRQRIEQQAFYLIEGKNQFFKNKEKITNFLKKTSFVLKKMAKITF